LVGTLLSLQDHAEEGEGGERELKVLVEPEEEESISLQVTQWEAELNCPVSRELLDYSAFETLCRNYDNSVINLLQAEFTPVNVKADSSTSWKSVGWVALGCFVLHMLLLTGKGTYLSLEAERFGTQARDLYEEVYPNDKNTRDIKRRWQSHLRGSSAPEQQNDVLSVLAEAGRNMDGSRLQLENVNFSEQRGDLILQIRGASSDRLVEYVQRLVKLGMSAEVGTINVDQEDKSFQGSVRIRQVGRG